MLRYQGINWGHASDVGGRKIISFPIAGTLPGRAASCCELRIVPSQRWRMRRLFP
jgi:hypothetical protein